MAKTKMVTTHHNGRGKTTKKDQLKHMTKKVHKTHKGYPQRRMVKSHLQTKRGKKR